MFFYDLLVRFLIFCYIFCFLFLGLISPRDEHFVGRLFCAFRVPLEPFSVPVRVTFTIFHIAGLLSMVSSLVMLMRR